MSKSLFHWARSLDLPRGPYQLINELAYCHSEEKGCFPSQKHLVQKTKMKRASVNTHLKTLEEAGLIRREQRKTASGKQASTLYHFPAFEALLTNEQKSAAAVSKKAEDPCPENSKTRVQKLDTIENSHKKKKRACEGSGTLKGDRHGSTGCDSSYTTLEEHAEFWEKTLLAGRYVPPSALSSSLRKLIIARGRVECDVVERL